MKKKYHIIENKFKEIISYFENVKYPLYYSFITLAAATVMRNTIEIFSVFYYVKNNQFPYYRGAAETLSAEVNIHYFISYIALYFSLAIIFNIITRVEVNKILRLISPFFFILVFAQICDIIISGGSNLCYFTPGYHNNLLSRYLTFYGEFKQFGGVTIGMKIEVVIILFISFMYVKIKTSSVFKGFLTACILYSLLFFYGMTPFVIEYLFRMADIPVNITQMDFILYFFGLALFTGVIILVLHYLQNKKKSAYS